MLQEILTVKSDDVDGRTRIYESMVKGDGSLTYGTPMAFEVLMNEIRGLGLDIRLHRPEDMSFDAAPATLDFGGMAKDGDGPEQDFIADAPADAQIDNETPADK